MTATKRNPKSKLVGTGEKKPDKKPVKKETATRASYPWDKVDNTRRRALFNVRLTDAELEKLRFIAETTQISMHEFCVAVLVPAIEKKVEVLTRKKSSA